MILTAGALVCLQAQLTCVLARRSHNHFVRPINICVPKPHRVRILLLMWKLMGERKDDKLNILVCEISEQSVWIWVNLYIFQSHTPAFLSFRDKSRK